MSERRRTERELRGGWMRAVADGAIVADGSVEGGVGSRLLF